MYVNLYTFIRTFVYQDIDNQLTPTNILSFMQTIGVNQTVLANFKATQDGGMTINVRALAQQQQGNQVFFNFY